MEYAYVIRVITMIMESVSHHLSVQQIQSGINKIINANALIRGNTSSMDNVKDAKLIKYGLRINVNANRNIS